MAFSSFLISSIRRATDFVTRFSESTSARSELSFSLALICSQSFGMAVFPGPIVGLFPKEPVDVAGGS
jgi:hypothetical protein